jgi:hypothetical protein
MPTSTYDLIVIGDDLAGLIAAALCARRGLRVLVVETPASPPDKYALGGLTLPRAPLPFVGESSPAVRRVVAELNFIQTLKRRLLPLKPALQIVLPDARIEISSDGDALKRELLRELPAQQGALEAFFARAAEVSRVLEPVLGQDVTFPPDGFWHRHEIAGRDKRLPGADEDLLPGVPVGHPARALCNLPAAFLCGADPRSVTTAAAARTFDLVRRGVARMEGGREALRQMLLEKLEKQHAGEVMRGVPTTLVTKWGKVSGIIIEGETVGCQSLIWSGPIGELGALVDKPPKRILAAQSAFRATAARYVLHVVLSEAGVPEGISPLTLCVADPERPLTGDNALMIAVEEPDDDARVLVTAVANLALEDGDDPAARAAELRGKVLMRLEEILPFSLGHLLLMHSPNQALPPEGPEATEGKAPQFGPELLWSSSLPATLGVGGLPYDAGIKGVIVASSQTLPGLGLEGAFAAGWCAARQASALSGKKKDYLKDEVLAGG